MFDLTDARLAALVAEYSHTFDSASHKASTRLNLLYVKTAFGGCHD